LVGPLGGDAVIAFVALIVAIVILDLLAFRFGADSRDGFGDARRHAQGFWSNEGAE
jgi:hypothetical protein